MFNLKKYLTTTIITISMLCIPSCLAEARHEYVPDVDNLFTISEDTNANVNTIMDNNFVKGGKLWTNDGDVDGLEVFRYMTNYDGKETQAVKNTGSLQDYQTNIESRKALANRLIEMLTYDIKRVKGELKDNSGKTIARYQDVSEGEVDSYVKERQTRINNLKTNSLDAVNKELVQLLKDADFTILGGGLYSYWEAQRNLRVFLGIKDYLKDAEEIPKWDTELKSKYNLTNYAKTVDKNGNTINNINNVFVVGNFEKFLNNCNTQWDLYNDNLNRLFNFIQTSVNNGKIKPTKGKTVVLYTKPENPMKVCDLSYDKETLNRSLTDNEYNWYAAIGDAYGGMAAKVTFSDSSTYNVEVNYYLQDEYLWGKNYDRKTNRTSAASEGGMSILAAAGKVYTGDTSGNYFKSKTTYYPKEYKMVGAYKKTYENHKLSGRFTTDRLTDNKSKNLDYDADAFEVYFKNENGTTIASYEKTTNQTVSGPNASVSKAGYKLVGWWDKLSEKHYDADAKITVTKDMILIPEYKKVYNVNYLDENGKIYFTDEVKEGEYPNRSFRLTKEGYTFVGWDSNYSKPVYSDVTIKPIFTINQYTVTFKDQWQKVLKTQKVNYGSSAVAPTSSEYNKEGYTFTGWDKNFSNIKSDLVVTANYTINKYTVTFKDYNGRTIKSESVEYGNSATSPSEPSRTGYKFIMWDKSFSDIKSDLEVTAIYGRNRYTVEFIDFNDTILSTQYILFGDDAEEPEKPVREGYEFTGWDKSFKGITSDKNINAEYRMITNRVTFKDNITGKTISSQDVSYKGNAILITAPKVEGYTFSGFEGNYTNVTSAQEVIVKYNINNYSVTFEDEEGTVLDKQVVKYKENAKAPTIADKDGYTFEGWDSSFEDVKDNIVVKAKYSKNKYKVVFKDGDNNELSNQTIEYGESAKAPDEPQKTGYVFDHWDKSFDSINADMEITPVYKIKEYSVVFKGRDGSIISSQKVEYGKSAAEPKVPEVEGYTFVKWTKAFDSIKKDTVIKALYKGQTCNIEFLDIDGDVIETQQVNYGEGAKAPELYDIEGKEFVKWDIDFDNVEQDLTVKPIYKNISDINGDVNDHNEAVNLGDKEDITDKEEIPDNKDNTEDGDLKEKPQNPTVTGDNNIIYLIVFSLMMSIGAFGIKKSL